MRRRTFLKTALFGAGSLAVPYRARAFGDTARLVIGQIQHGGRWNPRPTGLRRLSWELVQRTSIEAGEDAAPVRLGQEGLHHHPMLYLAGDGALPPFADAELAALRRHLQQG